MLWRRISGQYLTADFHRANGKTVDWSAIFSEPVDWYREDHHAKVKIREMASNQDFVDFVVDQLVNAGEIVAKKMFGEYGIYADGKLFGLICDNQLFIKPTTAGRTFIGEALVEAPPYPGAKPSFLIGEKIEDSAWLSELVRISVKELPMPKPKKKKKQ